MYLIGKLKIILKNAWQLFSVPLFYYRAVHDKWCLFKLPPVESGWDTYAKKKHFSNCYAPKRKNICLRMQRISPPLLSFASASYDLGIRLTTLLTREKATNHAKFVKHPYTTAVEPLVTTTQRLSGRLQESTDRRYLPEEVRTHLHFGREFITCNF